jgi:hypothetical protein
MFGQSVVGSDWIFGDLIICVALAPRAINFR